MGTLLLLPPFVDRRRVVASLIAFTDEPIVVVTDCVEALLVRAPDAVCLTYSQLDEVNAAVATGTVIFDDASMLSIICPALEFARGANVIVCVSAVDPPSRLERIQSAIPDWVVEFIPGGPCPVTFHLITCGMSPRQLRWMNRVDPSHRGLISLYAYPDSVMDSLRISSMCEIGSVGLSASRPPGGNLADGPKLEYVVEAMHTREKQVMWMKSAGAYGIELVLAWAPGAYVVTCTQDHEVNVDNLRRFNAASTGTLLLNIVPPGGICLKGVTVLNVVDTYDPTTINAIIDRCEISSVLAVRLLVAIPSDDTIAYQRWYDTMKEMFDHYGRMAMRCGT